MVPNPHAARRFTLAGRLVLLVTMAALLLSACAAQPVQEEPTPTPLPTPVIPTKPTYTVQPGEVVRKLEFTGRVVPVIQEDLFFKTSGRVDKVLVKKGDQVKAGQLLANLESGTSAIGPAPLRDLPGDGQAQSAADRDEHPQLLERARHHHGDEEI